MTGDTIGIDLMQAGVLDRWNKVAPAGRLRPCGDSSVWLSISNGISLSPRMSFGRPPKPACRVPSHTPIRQMALWTSF